MKEPYDEVTMKRVLGGVELIPGDAKRLYSMLNLLSKNGKERCHGTAHYYHRALGVSRKTYYRWRQQLIELGVISVETRKTGRADNKSSLIKVVSLRTLNKRMYEAAQRAVYDPSDTRIPVPYLSNLENYTKEVYEPTLTYYRLMADGLKQSTYEMLMAKGIKKEGLGMTMQPPFAPQDKETERKQREDKRQKAMFEEAQSQAVTKRQFVTPPDGPTVLPDGTQQWASPALLRLMADKALR